MEHTREDHEGHRGKDEDDARVLVAKLLQEGGDLRTAFLRGGSHAGDAHRGGVLAQAGGLDDEYAVGDAGAGGDLLANAFGDGEGLAGDVLGGDESGSVDDLPVEGDLLAGAY
eukprot:9481259-Pyramimonas_sp.AAC.2